VEVVDPNAKDSDGTNDNWSHSEQPKSGVARLLVNQQRLDYLRVDASKAAMLLPVLNRLASMGGCKVKHLDFKQEIVFATKEDDEAVYHLLHSSCFHGTEMLSCGRSGMSAVAEGKYLGLTKLSIYFNLRTNNNWSGTAEADEELAASLALALRSGHLKLLRELDLSPWSQGNVVVIGEALRDGSCPLLTKFSILPTLLLPLIAHHWMVPSKLEHAL